MPPHGLYGNTRGVRWNEEIQCFTLKCDDCARKGNIQYYWPLVLELWNPNSMQRCRACNLDKKRREAKKARQDPIHREKLRIAAAAYYEENKPIRAMKHKDYMKGYRQRKRDEQASSS